MAKLSLKQGTTSKLIRFYAENQDGSGPFVGLVFNSTGLKAYYASEGAASMVITLLTGGVIGTYSPQTLNPVDAANMPGVYELGLPNAALASGKSVWLMLQGVVNLAPVEIEIELTAVDNQSTTAFVSSVPSVVGAVGSVAGSVGSVTGLASLIGTPAVSIAADIAAIETSVLALPTSILDLANGVETGITLRQAMRLFTSILAGKATDSSGVYTLKRQDGTTTAVTITHDSVGNRTSVVIGSL